MVIFPTIITTIICSLLGLPPHGSLWYHSAVHSRAGGPSYRVCMKSLRALRNRPWYNMGSWGKVLLSKHFCLGQQMAWRHWQSIYISLRALVNTITEWVLQMTWDHRGSPAISIDMRGALLIWHREWVWQMTWRHAPPLPDWTLIHHYWGLTWYILKWIFTCGGEMVLPWSPVFSKLGPVGWTNRRPNLFMSIQQGLTEWGWHWTRKFGIISQGKDFICLIITEWTDSSLHSGI